MIDIFIFLSVLGSVIGGFIYFIVWMDEFDYFRSDYKRRLACLLLGPLAWFGELVRFIFHAFFPIIEWFGEE